jgi:hypothetical protein
MIGWVRAERIASEEDDLEISENVSKVNKSSWKQ